MVYGVHADTELKVGGWPQFFKTVFHVRAKSKQEAEKVAKRELDKVPVTYDKLFIEYLGREYRVSSNEELRVVCMKYGKDSITKVTIFEGTMQIIIDCNRNGREDNDNIGVWCRPADFKEAVDALFSKIKYEEI